MNRSNVKQIVMQYFRENVKGYAMKRRHFLANAATQCGVLAAGPAAWAMGENRELKQYGSAQLSPTVVDKIGRYSLAELREFHMKELREHYLGFWDKQGIDWEYGGFYTYYDGDDTIDSENKEMYYLGRGIWVFSYLYNHFGKNERHIKAAKMAIDFIFKYCRDENGYWISEVTRDGKFVTESVNIYGDMYVAMGLGEYYHGTGDENARKVAIETCHGVSERIVSPEYMHLGGHGTGHEPGTKRLGTWQHFLSVLTPLARYTNDFGVEMFARMCVRNILERHYRREYGLAFEHLDDLFQPFLPDPNNNHRFISSWHSVQAAWMCMDEALRVNDRRMFMDALELGRVTLEKCWFDGDESNLTDLSEPEEKPTTTGDLVWGRLDDAMVFTLLAIEHTHAPWAVYWFDKVFTRAYERPDLFKRPCLLHHPRRLFFCIDILDHMITRQGRVSNFFEG